MKKGILFAAIFCSAISVSAQFKGFEVIKIDNKGKVPGKTYRVYAVMTNETDQVYALGGLKEAPAYVRSTKPFYQNATGGPSSLQINRKLSNEIPGVKYDSYLTLGREDNYENRLQLFTVDTDGFELGKNLEISDGGWWVLPDQKQTVAGPEKRVLIMQLTTEGEISGKLNVSGKRNFPPGADGQPKWETIDVKGATFSSATVK